MKLIGFVCIPVAVSELILPSDWQGEQELYNDYCFEQQYEVDAWFNPLETFAQIQENAETMIGAIEFESETDKSAYLAVYGGADVKRDNLTQTLLYYDSLHRSGVDSIRKLYFGQLRSIELVKQTALSRANEVLLVRSSDFDFSKHIVHQQRATLHIDTLAMASIQKVSSSYKYLLDTLDSVCEEEVSFQLQLQS
ncbi:hypothetical protein DSO57_1001085 [Entomophthora muscae]|uniref:Uncharacterized protein n=1 Tax=Entomophthora muscae TaxID=34485 RepID=A0ACC2SAW3_9FUNG|nr:hypothetical protein DSO57_1001085 [Entomophthora muscae]